MPMQTVKSIPKMPNVTLQYAIQVLILGFEEYKAGWRVRIRSNLPWSDQVCSLGSTMTEGSNVMQRKQSQDYTVILRKTSKPTKTFVQWSGKIDCLLKRLQGAGWQEKGPRKLCKRKCSTVPKTGTERSVVLPDSVRQA